MLLTYRTCSSNQQTSGKLCTYHPAVPTWQSAHVPGMMLIPLVDYRGARDAFPLLGPIFFSTSCSFPDKMVKIIGWRTPTLGSAPLSGYCVSISAGTHTNSIVHFHLLAIQTFLTKTVIFTMV